MGNRRIFAFFNRLLGGKIHQERNYCKKGSSNLKSRDIICQINHSSSSNFSSVKTPSFPKIVAPNRLNINTLKFPVKGIAAKNNTTKFEQIAEKTFSWAVVIVNITILSYIFLFPLSNTAFAGELNNQFTISVWVNPQTSIASKALAVKDSEIRLVTDASGNPLCQIYASGAWQSAVTSSTALSLNSWSNVACTYNKANIYVYVNGVQTGSGAQTNAVNDAATNFLTGQDDSGTYANFIGTTDHLEVYNYARTQKQVIEDMGGGHPAVLAGSSGPSSVIASAARQSGPVGWYKFDEGYGTTAHNSGSQGETLQGSLSGFASPATTTSGWTQAGKFNRGLVFDRSDDWVSIPDSGSTLEPSNITVSAWAKLDSSATNGYYTIVGNDNASACAYRGWGLQFQNSTSILVFFLTDSIANGHTATYTSGTSLAGSWVHVVGTYDGQNVKIYVNGLLGGTTAYTGAMTTATENLRIGNKTGCGSSVFNGTIDDVKIYPYALTADEVKLDYNKGSSLVLGALSDTNSLNTSQPNSAASEYCVPGDTTSTSCATPVGRWDFEEGSGTSAKDVSGNGYNGTITGATYKTGKVGKGLNFNGSSDVVDTISSISGIKTVSFWVNPSTTTQNLIDLQTTPSTVNVSVSGGTVSATGFTSPTIYVNGVSGGTITANTWSHVEITTGTAITGSAVRFGRISTTSLTGKLDNIRFFNYARSGAQIAWDYNRGAPVAHYKMDECQGDTAHDSSGNNNHGTISLSTTGTQTTAIGMGTCTTNASTPWYNGRTGKFNSSLNFDGTDDYVIITSPSNIPTGSSAFTINLWVKPSSNVTNKYIIKWGSLSTNNMNAIVFDGTYSRIWHAFYSNDLYALTGSVPIDFWTHLVITFDGTTRTIYTNGVRSSQDTPVGVNVTAGQSLYFGASGGGGNNFPGQIDDVRVYNYALTPLQVKMLFNQNSAIRYGPVTGSP